MVGLFFASEAKIAKYPVMPLGLFKQRSNIAALVCVLFPRFGKGSIVLPCWKIANPSDVYLHRTISHCTSKQLEVHMRFNQNY
jgi:hypothetical protein